MSTTALFRVPPKARLYGLLSSICRRGGKTLVDFHVHFAHRAERQVSEALAVADPEFLWLDAHKHCMAGGPNDETCCCDACNAQVALLVLARDLDPDENEALTR